MIEQTLIQLIESSIKEHWDLPALSDYKGITLHYRDLARRIEKLHIIFEECGLRKGDKVAICSRNQANWGVVLLACLTYGAVPVPILHEFKPSNIHHIVNHSDSRILFCGDIIWESLSQTEMPNLEAIILINDFSMLYVSRNEIMYAREHLNQKFGEKYPARFLKTDVSYNCEVLPDSLAMISYTSGTSGFSKGVMIPHRALLSNIEFARLVHPTIRSSAKVVSMLPSAHMYGFLFEFLFEMTVGAHVQFLTRIPSPRIILEAFDTVKPDLIIAVPLIIEKIYKQKLQPILNKMSVKVLLKVPVIDQKIQQRIKDELIKSFGGNFKEIIIGGAPFNKEADAFFHKIGFPYTIGYGMTECAPIIAYAPCKELKLYSCGRVAPNMKIRIDSADPVNVPGEIQVCGANVMLGYYKNPEATAAAFTEDGWMKTGDMGVLDRDGFLFIKGRCKSMILGPSGQNIYPEEIESVINNMPYVSESLVIEDNGKLVALIYPDMDAAAVDGITTVNIQEKIEEIIFGQVNEEMPNYSKIAEVKIYPEEFEKTPKRSIKRYLYQK